MRGLALGRVASGVVVAIVMLAGRETAVSAAQIVQQPTYPAAGQAPGFPRRADDSDSKMTPERERMQVLADEHEKDVRRKKMMSDAVELLQLSTELKAEVEKAGKDELSLSVIRKAERIEKLAHQVKERMKN